MRALQRWPIVGALGALLVGSVLLDNVPDSLSPELAEAATVPIRSSIAEPTPLTTSWYCAIGSSDPSGYAGQVINVSNVSDETAIATVSVLTDSGSGNTLRLELGPYDTQSVDIGNFDVSDNTGAVVEIVGGNGVVGHDVETEHGTASGPCATTVSGQWFFASGSTRRDSNQYLALMNPFGEDVVLDVTFRTATRERRPEDLASLVVPGRTVRVIDVADFVSIEAVVATTVTTIQGRVVAEQLQVANGDLGPEGAALVLGTPAASTNWVLPAGRVTEESDHRLVIHNPSETQAELELDFSLSTLDRRTAYGLASIELSVQPGRFESLDVADLVGALQIPLPLEFGVEVRSANDVPVVVSRTQMYPPVDNTLVGAEDDGATVSVEGGGEGDPEENIGEPDEQAVTVDPSTIERRDPLTGNLVRQDDIQEDLSVDDLPRDITTLILDDLAQATAETGLGVSNGGSVASQNWVVPYSQIYPDGGTVLVITAAENALVSIQGMVDGQLLDADRVSVDGQTRRVVPLTLPVPRSALLVSSDSPIVIELQTVANGQLTVSGAVPVLAK